METTYGFNSQELELVYDRLLPELVGSAREQIAMGVELITVPLPETLREKHPNLGVTPKVAKATAEIFEEMIPTLLKEKETEKEVKKKERIDDYISKMVQNYMDNGIKIDGNIKLVTASQIKVMYPELSPYDVMRLAKMHNDMISDLGKAEVAASQIAEMDGIASSEVEGSGIVLESSGKDEIFMGFEK